MSIMFAEENLQKKLMKSASKYFLGISCADKMNSESGFRFAVKSLSLSVLHLKCFFY